MPRTSVIADARTNPRRSSRRIDQTANWQVNELRIRIDGQDRREPRLGVEVERLRRAPVAAGRSAARRAPRPGR